jgi:hypothetical protein
MLYNLPKGNVLLHSGDATNRGRRGEITEFIQWFKSIEGFDQKIFIAGNHDFAFEQMYLPNHKEEFDWLRHLLHEENLSQSKVTYLFDNQIIINHPEISRPILIYGSPWQPEFYNWAFNLPRNGNEIEEKWNNIPNNTDILITHGPPFGHLDFAPMGGHVGCKLLHFRVNEIKPKIHVFGHIHDGYGVKQNNDITYVNASICTERYEPINKPIILDLEEINGDLKVNIVEYE